MKTLIERIQFITQDIYKIIIGYIQPENERIISIYFLIHSENVCSELDTASEQYHQNHV